MNQTGYGVLVVLWFLGGFNEWRRTDKNRDDVKKRLIDTLRLAPFLNGDLVAEFLIIVAQTLFVLFWPVFTVLIIPLMFSKGGDDDPS